MAEMWPVTANSLCEQTKSQTYSKNLGISQRAIVERLNINLAHVNEIIAGLAYRMCVLDGHRITVHRK